MEVNPEAQSYFNLKKTKLHFTFPKPGYIEDVKSKGKALMKMEGYEFTYGCNITPTITGITVQVSLSSRVALLGPNGAGKSTLIKLLVGENVPDKNKGKTWKHPGRRFAYVAQHAFAHIEDHLDKTPNEYVRWRYQSGKDKETTKKQTLIEAEEELKKQTEIFIYKWRDEESGKEFQAKRVVHHVLPERQMNKSIKSMSTYYMPPQPTLATYTLAPPHSRPYSVLYDKVNYVCTVTFPNPMYGLIPKEARRPPF